jgi:hypothetical protein
MESEEIEYPDGQKVIIDGLGISHFIMPPKCKGCDD